MTQKDKLQTTTPEVMKRLKINFLSRFHLPILNKDHFIKQISLMTPLDNILQDTQNDTAEQIHYGSYEYPLINHEYHFIPYASSGMELIQRE